MNVSRELNHYRLESLIGSSKYADVYQATDTIRKRSVTLKLLKTEFLAGVRDVARFLQQAQRASDLVHPHLAWMWETGEAGGRYYLVERYVNGPSLAQVLAEAGPLPWEQALQIFRQIAQGLDFAHAKGWVHADIQPGNILLSPDLGAVLAEFGLTRALQAGKRKPVGDARYRAPELWQGQAGSPATDQYALACVVFQALTAQPLFDAPTNAALEALHSGGLDLAARAADTLPVQTVAVLQKALAQQAEERYPNAAALVEALAQIPASERPAILPSRQPGTLPAWRQTSRPLPNPAEEAARLAALEQARQEIEEQLRREAEARSQAIESAALEPGAEPPRPERSRRKPSRKASASSFWRRWPIIAGALLILVLVLGGLFLDSSLSRQEVFPATVTPTPVPPTATFTPTWTQLPTATHTPTFTATATATVTRTATSTATFTPTITLTPTITQTSTRTATLTRTPKQPSDDSVSGESPARP